VRPGWYGLDPPQTPVSIILSPRQTPILMRQYEKGDAVLCLLALGCTLNAPAECTTHKPTASIPPIASPPLGSQSGG
jgi:hypothetical protein